MKYDSQRGDGVTSTTSLSSMVVTHPYHGHNHNVTETSSRAWVQHVADLTGRRVTSSAYHDGSQLHSLFICKRVCLDDGVSEMKGA